MNLAGIIDISTLVEKDMPQYPGQPPINFESVKTIERDGSAESILSIYSHAGTHVDAPSHFILNGKTVDQIDPSKLVGHCRVIDLSKTPGLEIQASDLSSPEIKTGDRILLKTKNSLGDRRDFENFVSVSEEGARFLVDRGIVLVGTDFFGIEKRRNPGHPVHIAFLEKDVVVVEGLDLSKVEEGEYEIMCLPIKVKGVDGAPARVFLKKYE